MKICIPSSNRATKVKTNFIPNSFLFVPEEQAEEYRDNNEIQVIEVPAEFTGITKTRNFILDYFKGENIVMLDDDVIACGYLKRGERISFKNNPELLLTVFERSFQTIKDLGYNVFGLESGGSKLRDFTFKPFKFRGSINGSCIGIIENGMRFDEEFQVKEDFDFILRSYKKYGGFLKVDYAYFQTQHWANKGGCVDYRTNQMEMDCINLLNKRHKRFIKVGKGKNLFYTSLVF